MEKGYIIGIDSGTSMVKAALSTCRKRGLRRGPFHPGGRTHFGWSEFDMDTDWSEVSTSFAT